jgi:hypothetical protein
LPGHHPALLPPSDPPGSLIISQSRVQKNRIHLNWSNSEEVEQLLKDNYNKLQIQEHIEEIKIAVRAGLIWHPLVADFIYTRKALGSKEILRKIRRGWETGVKRPLTINGLKFRNRLEKIAEYREEGKTWEQIRRILMKGKIINKMSWQALQKKFEKAWEEEWKKVNKKPPPIP